MPPTEFCRCCGSRLDKASEGVARVPGTKPVAATVVRFRCPGCLRGGSIYYRDGSILDRIGPSVAPSIQTQIDAGREPQSSPSTRGVATDGGRRER